MNLTLTIDADNATAAILLKLLLDLGEHYPDTSNADIIIAGLEELLNQQSRQKVTISIDHAVSHGIIAAVLARYEKDGHLVIDHCVTYATCDFCGGDGVIACVTCKGTGKDWPLPGVEDDCPDCDGEIICTCPDCEGSGREEKS
jgi:hypothetical protein